MAVKVRIGHGLDGGNLRRVGIEASIIICTHNRAASLERTLESLERLTVPAGLAYEILVVDNRSEDKTRQVVHSFMERSGLPLRYVYEEELGLSAARNRGVEEAAGEVLVFTDDDVIVDPQWLQALVDAHRQFNAAAVGGKILPQWPGERPRWYRDSIRGAVVHLDFGEELRDLTADELTLWGANLSVKRSRLERVGGFDSGLGRKGQSLTGGEETLLQQQIRAHGGRVLYTPNAVVWHVISPQRATRSFFRRWAFGQGRTEAMLEGRPEVKELFGYPRYMCRRLAGRIWDWMKDCVARGPDAAFEAELKLRSYLGGMPAWRHGGGAAGEERSHFGFGDDGKVEGAAAHTLSADLRRPVDGAGKQDCAASRICCWPWDSGNPYMCLFYTAVARQGVSVEEGQARDGWKLPMPKDGSVLHLHYRIEEIYAGSNVVEQVQVLLRFMLDLVRLKWRGTPVVWTCHNLMPHEPGPMWVEWTARFFLAHSADAVFLHSDWARKEFRRLYLRNHGVHVIPHGTYEEAYDCESISREKARESLGIPSETFVYSFFGNLRPYKGIPELLAAFRAIPHREVRLRVTGFPKCTAMGGLVEKAAKQDKRITATLAFVPESEVPAHLIATDVLVFPFRKITTSGSLVLGFTFGLPVIVPACGLTKELLGEDYPLLYPAGSQSGLLQAMLKARELDLEALANRVRSVARELSWTRGARQFARIVQRL